jgi:hypothetical protein
MSRLRGHFWKISFVELCQKQLQFGCAGRVAGGHKRDHCRLGGPGPPGERANVPGRV